MVADKNNVSPGSGPRRPSSHPDRVLDRGIVFLCLRTFRGVGTSNTKESLETRRKLELRLGKKEREKDEGGRERGGQSWLDPFI